MLNTTAADSLLMVAESDQEVVGFISASIYPPMEDAARQFVRDVNLMRLSVNALLDQRVLEVRHRHATDERCRGVGRQSGAVIALLDTYVDSPVSVSFYE